MDIGGRIKAARTNKELSQTELAELIGVTRTTCSRWETEGKPYPSLKHLERLAVLLEVRFEWLATGRGVMDYVDVAVERSEQLRVLERDEKQILSLFNRLKTEKQEALLTFLLSY